MGERLYFKMRSAVFNREGYEKLSSVNNNAPLFMYVSTDEGCSENYLWSEDVEVKGLTW
jgi:hypothetical protein